MTDIDPDLVTCDHPVPGHLRGGDGLAEGGVRGGRNVVG